MQQILQRWQRLAINIHPFDIVTKPFKQAAVIL